MANCIYCGKPAGFFRHSHPECVQQAAEKERKHVEALTQLHTLATTALASGAEISVLSTKIREVTSSGLISEREIRSALAKTWSDSVNSFADANGIDRYTETRLIEFKRTFNLSQEELGPAFRTLSKAMVLQDVANGKIPTRVKLEDISPVNLKTGETLVWLFPGSQLLEDRTVRQYMGVSTGVSVRVMRGVYLRSSAFRGHPIETTERRVVDHGIVAFTNKNICFVGSRKGIRLPWSKIMSFQPFSEGIGFLKDGSNSKPEFLRTGDGWFTYNLATGLAHADATPIN